MLRISQARSVARLFAVASLATLVACGQIDGDDDPTFHVRGVNLITDSPTVKFYFGTTSIATTTFNGSSDWHAAEVGTFNMKLKVVHPATLDTDDDDDLAETDIGSTVSQSFAEGKDYTVFAYGTMADPKFYMLEATDQRETPDDNLVVYQVANVAPNAQTIDVYLTAPEASMATEQLVATLAPGQYMDPVKLTLQADPDAINEDATRTVEMTVRLKTAGTNNVIYTSPTLTASEKSRFLLAVADNVGSGPSPVKLLEVAGSSTTLLQSAGDEARLRFVNASKDSPPLDVVIGSFQNAIAQSVGFRGASPYSNTANGEIGLIARATGDPNSIAFIEEYSALPDQSYTAYAIGSSSDLDASVIAEDDRAVPTQARFRFVTAAASLKDDLLDLYVLPPGDTISFPDDDSKTTDTSPTFSSISYKSATGYLTLEGGGFDVYVAKAGTENILLGPIRLDVPNGDNQTVLLADNESGSLELIPVSDTTH
jgi:hypothetical protein